MDAIAIHASDKFKMGSPRAYAAQAHHGYLFANARGTRIKRLVHDRFGVRCAARRLNIGRFVSVQRTVNRLFRP